MEETCILVRVQQARKEDAAVFNAKNCEKAEKGLIQLQQTPTRSLCHELTHICEFLLAWMHWTLPDFHSPQLILRVNWGNCSCGTILNSSTRSSVILEKGTSTVCSSIRRKDQPHHVSDLFRNL